MSYGKLNKDIYENRRRLGYVTEMFEFYDKFSDSYGRATPGTPNVPEAAIVIGFSPTLTGISFDTADKPFGSKNGSDSPG